MDITLNKFDASTERPSVPGGTTVPGYCSGSGNGGMKGVKNHYGTSYIVSYERLPSNTTTGDV